MSCTCAAGTVGGIVLDSSGGAADHERVRALDTEMVAIDFETTGAVGDWPDEPWQIGMAPIREGRIDVEAACTSLLGVGDRPFNPSVPGRHRRFAADLARSPRLVERWPDFRAWWLGRPLVAHNAATEQKILRQTAPLHRMGPWIDTLRLARAAYPDEPSHALESLLDRLELLDEVASLCPGLQPHDALFDAVGCARLLLHLLAQPGWEGASVAELVGIKPSGRGRRKPPGS